MGVSAWELFRKKMKKGCVGNKWGWRYAMLMLMGGVEEGSQGGTQNCHLEVPPCLLSSVMSLF